MSFVSQSCHAQTPDCDSPEVCLSQSLSLKHEEEFENFQESAIKRTKINFMDNFQDFNKFSVSLYNISNVQMRISVPGLHPTRVCQEIVLHKID